MSDPLTLACVVWTDAHGNAYTTYEAHEVPHAPAIVHTFGLIVRRDDTGITLAHEVFASGGYRGVTFIPTGMIQEVQAYAPARRPRRPQSEVVPRRTTRGEPKPMERPCQDSRAD